MTAAVGIRNVLFELCILVVTIHCAKETNLAYKKTALQSSNYNDFAADRAVDGKTSDTHNQGTCSTTSTHLSLGQESKCWWQVDLGSQYRIGHVRILNRADCCPERLHDFKIDVAKNTFGHSSRQTCLTFRGNAKSGWLNLSCDRPVLGRTVRITKPKKNISDPLTLCEVEIYEATGTTIKGVGDHQTVTRESVFGCAMSCLNIDSCHSFNFRNREAVCELVSNSRATLGDAPGYSIYFWRGDLHMWTSVHR